MIFMVLDMGQLMGCLAIWIAVYTHCMIVIIGLDYTNNDGEVTSFIGEDTGVKNNIYASRFCDHDTGTCWNLDGTIYVGSALHLMPNTPLDLTNRSAVISMKDQPMGDGILDIEVRGGTGDDIYFSAPGGTQTKKGDLAEVYYTRFIANR